MGEGGCVKEKRDNREKQPLLPNRHHLHTRSFIACPSLGLLLGLTLTLSASLRHFTWWY